MVLVEDVSANDESTSSNANQNNSSPSSSSNSSSRPTATPTNARASSQDLMSFILQDKISAVLWFTRILTLIFSIMFIIPIFGFDPNTLYQKAMMSSAATSALKLHQRMNNVPFQLNREYLAKLIIEDSFHYLLYSFIFLSSAPVTIILMPVAAFALLHIAVYTKSILNLVVGTESAGPLQRALNAILAKDKDLMRFIAINEIIIAPTIIIMIFWGKAGIFVPFIYYRFICMRYQSRRNPYNRIMFYELRTIIEYYTSQPNCPGILRSLSQNLINLVNRFAPQQLA
jgi:hypothetical protein